MNRQIRQRHRHCLMQTFRWSLAGRPVTRSRLLWKWLRTPPRCSSWISAGWSAPRNSTTGSTPSLRWTRSSWNRTCAWSHPPPPSSPLCANAVSASLSSSPTRSATNYLPPSTPQSESRLHGPLSSPQSATQNSSPSSPSPTISSVLASESTPNCFSWLTNKWMKMTYVNET